MAGIHFDFLRQGLEALENLSMQAIQNAQTPQQASPQADAEPEPLPDKTALQTASAVEQTSLSKTQVKPQAKRSHKSANLICNAQQLRRAIILSEILAPPLAHRHK